ncbi:MAG: hypothetical protein Q9174_006032 [Haloplaca sp. 1 TL-2023]
MSNGLRALRGAVRFVAPICRPALRQHLVFTPVSRRSYASVSAADEQFGQPVHETHPHLLKPGELTPGITALEYAQRRSKLASKLSNNGIAILAAADVKYRSGAVFYDYHQESNFFYLTGKSNSQDDHTFHLFVRPKNPKEEQWDGSRSGTQAALDVFNADESGDIKDIDKHLTNLISSASSIYTDALPSSSTSPFSRIVHTKPSPSSSNLSTILDRASVKPLKSLMNDLRNIKSDAEIDTMRIAGKASGRAFTEAMRCNSWTKEKDLAAFLEYKFKRNGCDTSAYVPVVAGGKNASQIHYVRNDDVLLEQDLVLADAGGEYGNYITDITRSWPISGTFTPPQKDLYNAILATQRTCISLCRASSANSLDKLHEIAENTLKDSLKGLGFDMSGNVRGTPFYPSPPLLFPVWKKTRGND